jgi:hypothetical protein
MAKMKFEAATEHRKATELANLDRDLTPSEREFVLDHWMEEGTARLDGAFFTPGGLAVDLAIDVFGARVIDLCAGIGRLAWTAHQYLVSRGEAREIVCVEKNPEYVRIGRKVLPEATWICADVFDVPHMDLGGPFDMAIANPPFGSRVSRGGRKAPRYGGGLFEYHVIDVAAEVARHGAFIIPQESAPFRYSGRIRFEEERTTQYDRFESQTGITLEQGCSTDTTQYSDEWRDAAPRVEIVTADFAARQATAVKSGAAAPSKDWRGMAATDFATRPKAAQVAMFDVGDDKGTGTIGLFDI